MAESGELSSRRSLGALTAATVTTSQIGASTTGSLNVGGDAEPLMRQTLAGFLDQEASEIDRFYSVCRGRGALRRQAWKQSEGSTLVVGSVLNFAAEPARLPLVKSTVFEFAEQAADFPRPTGGAVEVYEKHLEFARLARKKLEEAGLPIRDMLDVQSVIWEAFSRSKQDDSERLRRFFETVLQVVPGGSRTRRVRSGSCALGGVSGGRRPY